MDSCCYNFGHNGVRRRAVIRAALALFLVSTVTATTSLKPTQLTLEPPQPPPSWNHSAEDLIRLAKDATAQIQKQGDIISALAPQDCNFTSVVLSFAHASAQVSSVVEPVCFYKSVSPFPELRHASAEARRLILQVFLRLDVQNAIFYAEKNIKASGEWDKLSAEDKRLVEGMARSGTHSAAALSDEAIEEVAALQMGLSEISLEFMTNFNGENGVVSFTSAELKGVPMDVISGYRKRTEGLNEIYDVTLKAPDMAPITRFAEDPATRKRAYEVEQERLAVNVPLVDKAVDVRRKIAKILGYTSWADYVTETRMIKNAKNVESFLNDLESKLRPMALKERELLLAIKEAEHKEKGLPYDGQLYYWDSTYYGRKYANTLTLNNTLVKDYFPVSAVVPAVLNLYQDLLSVRFEEVKGSSTWHPDVQHFAVWRKNATDASGFIGYCYLDLFPREFKYSHAAVFTLRPGYEKPDGTRSYPVVAMVANLAKPTPDKPALMQHNEVVTFFHELGHVFHGLLSRTKYSQFHGLTVSSDFIEAPSQMLENWCWEPKVLKMISSHYQTKEPLSTDLINEIVKRRHINVGMLQLWQIFFAKFDMQLHNAQESRNSTELWNTLKDRITLLKSDKPGLGQGSFHHIMNGYDAGYYGYIYSRVFAADMYATVFKADPLDPVRGAKYENAILRPGSSRDELESLEDFLGRPPSQNAFIQQLFGHAADQVAGVKNMAVINGTPNLLLIILLFLVVSFALL